MSLRIKVLPMRRDTRARRGNRRVLSLLMLSTVAAVAAGATLLREQGTPPAPAAGKQAEDINKLYEDYPIADLNAAEPADPDERATRRARSRRYNNRDLSAAEAERFRIQEGRGSSLGAPNPHSPAEPALPVAQSDAVVVGEVTSAEAFLSADRVTVYSEFNLRVIEVLKNQSPTPLALGVQITADRFGGRVRLPSGKVIAIGFVHQSMPQPGRRYLLFLNYVEETRTYSIRTGYELRAGKVFPLDGNRRVKGATKYREVAGYDRFNGTGEAALLDEAKRVVANPASGKAREK